MIAFHSDNVKLLAGLSMDCISPCCFCHCDLLLRDYNRSSWMQTAAEPSWRMVYQTLEERQRILGELKLCKDLQKGKDFHAKISECGNDSCVSLKVALIKMYSRCGSMSQAHQVFDSIKHPDVMSWTALILGYVDNGEGETALDLFASMRSQGCAPNSFTFVAALKACSSLSREQCESRRMKCLERGLKMHLLIGCLPDIYVQNTLMIIYARCKSMIHAHQVFDSIKHPTVVSWTALILGYAENGQGPTALDLFATMRFQGFQPNSFTFVAALKACTCLSLIQPESGITECLQRVKEIHSQIGCHLDVHVQITLINTYAKCGSMIDARQIFDNMKHPSVVAWTALLMGYAENGEGLTALALMSKMQTQGCAPDSCTIVVALKACMTLAIDKRAECLKHGKEIHSQIGNHSNLYVQNTLMNMYVKCGSMIDARQVFDRIKHPSVVSWKIIILGYTEAGDGISALDMFARMKSQGCEPNSLTFVAALKACTSLAVQNPSVKADYLQHGKQIHLQIGCHSDMYIQSTLIDMYAKCDSMVDARKVFDTIKYPDVVSWTALILGYVDNGEGVIALDLFTRISCEPNSFTFVAALKACSLIGALESGRNIHAQISLLTEPDVIVVTSLVDFYAKCGSVSEAHMIFDLYPRTRGLQTWTALLAGYSHLGDTEAVLGLFERMLDAGFQPDGVTFLCILTCCSHAGLIAKANEFFNTMPTMYRVAPTIEHYTCMVDIHGRSNKLDDALALLQSMPCKSNAVTWITVLGACRTWKNVEIGRLAFQSLLDFDDTNSAAYVLMAHIYGSRGMWKEQEMLLKRERVICQRF